MISGLWMFWEATALRLIVRRLIVGRGGHRCEESGKFYLKDMEFSLHKRKFLHCLEYKTKWGAGRISSSNVSGIVQRLCDKLKEWEAKEVLTKNERMKTNPE